MLQLRVTPKAESDLVGIWVYTCDEWAVDQADKHLDELEEGMNQLIHHPSLGADYSHVLAGYRRARQRFGKEFPGRIETKMWFKIESGWQLVGEGFRTAAQGPPDSGLESVESVQVWSTLGRVLPLFPRGCRVADVSASAELT